MDRTRIPRVPAGTVAVLGILALNACNRARAPTESQVRAAVSSYYDPASLHAYALRNDCYRSFPSCRNAVDDPAAPSISAQVQSILVKHVGHRQKLREHLPGTGYFMFDWWPARVEVRATCSCGGRQEVLIREEELDIAPGVDDTWYVR